ncbi:MAG TPA: helix-turn-helix transcriptional regulator [Ottowia sp.]|uniref:helix-turn-helix domain-containing protein n=1 Tax=Ottowia sp. TaxID=1898956 RepID=UPI002C0A9F5D|nr:helix-turn-helix transcriptional regulator [Ottowia sp.]HMN19831.1 helix-turn-helix transcriptional regulator [Ottowia sp.]
MNKVQVIHKNGKPAFYVVPVELWSKVRGVIEDAADAAAFDRAIAADEGTRYPAAVAHAIADGTQPLKAWRTHRGLTLQALADAAGLSKPYVSQLESGKRSGPAATLKRLARALDVPVDALTP